MKAFGRPLAVIVFIALAACARTSATVEIPPEDLPFSLARESTPMESPAPSTTTSAFFVRGDGLIRVQRRVGSDLPSVEVAVRTLLDGPTSTERAGGIGSELASEVRLLEIHVEARTAFVDLSGEFQEPAPPERIALRVAQVVWTLTELPDIDAVRFSIDGEVVAVITADGTATDRPVTRADYAALSPSG